MFSSIVVATSVIFYTASFTVTFALSYCTVTVLPVILIPLLCMTRVTTVWEKVKCLGISQWTTRNFKWSSWMVCKRMWSCHKYVYV